MSLAITNTIVAIATPMGLGGIGVVRVSGPDSLSIAKRFFSFANDAEVKPRYAYFGKIRDFETNTVLDEGCVLFFKGPFSYTGEDTVEFQCHSSPYVLEKLVALCCLAGARLALPGEFTKQAFVNGKLDLTQVEGVVDLIHSSTQKAHAVSLNHVQGGLLSVITEFRKVFVLALEQVDASLDFPEEVDPLDRDTFLKDLAQIQQRLDSIISNQDFGAYIFAGVSCVIVGRPNAGKSSLFNALVGSERAIVTDIEGTTRDYLEVPITLGGVMFRIVDTAGVRESHDYIEYLGIQKIQQLLEKADVVFFVCDGSKPFDQNDYAVIQKISNKSLVYCLFNKSDLPQLDQQVPGLICQRTFRLSASSGHGIFELKQALYTDFVENIERLNLDTVCTVRQLDCIKKVRAIVSELQEGLAQFSDDASLAIDIRRAVEVLGEVTGDVLTEEVLDGIFARFCIGK